MRRNRQAADIDGIAAFTARRLGEEFRVCDAEIVGRDHLEVVVVVHRVGRLVCDDLDARRTRALQHRLQHGGVVRHDTDHVDATGDQVFDGADLKGRVVAGRPDHEGLNAEFLGLLQDALLHGVEPRNPTDLDNDTDGGFGRCGTCRQQCGGGCAAQNLGHAFHGFLPVQARLPGQI